MAAPDRTVPELPVHLRRYAVEQDYGAYTPRDQAVWRHILRRLTAHLEGRAHPSYLAGLAQAGISVERIPSLAEMNDRLAGLGWRAVAVRGFIPPAVFTELQSLGVLAIAAEIRTHEHIGYTPAPDIVHESAGHAPILADPAYARYLKRCGVVGFKAIASAGDLAVYDAIRHLSVVKEDPGATAPALEAAEARLVAACASRTYVSESTRASRLYWWTAEYGLVGALDRPLIYGAGLLSSIGEAEHCLTAQVTKLPLSLACVDQDYDITRMQPQLFVARDFDHLFEVLEAFEATLAWRRGGDAGLEEALRARTVNHVVLEDGLAVTGQVTRLVRDEGAGSVRLAVLTGPGLLSRNGQVAGSGPWHGTALVVLASGTSPRGPFHLDLPGGLVLEGVGLEGQAVTALRAWLGGGALDLPGEGLLFFSPTVPSVAGGPGDPEAWDRWFGEPGSVEGEPEAQARRARAEALSPAMAARYREVRGMREGPGPDPGRLRQLLAELRDCPGEWLLREEIQELLGPEAPS